MDANQLLTSLGLAVGLPDLAFDGNGCARLLFDQRIAVNLEHDADAGCIHVYSVLGAVPPPGTGEALFRRLLEGNLFGSQTHGAALAVDGSSHEILLSRSLDVESASAEGFGRMVEKLLAASDHWTQELSGSAAGHAVQAPDSTAQPAHMPAYMMKA
ncbi:MAG: type III secretion system chaperone [Pseudomonadota bacterium]